MAKKATIPQGELETPQTLKEKSKRKPKQPGSPGLEQAGVGPVPSVTPSSVLSMEGVVIAPM